MKAQVARKRVVARLRGFEPPTSGSGDQRQNAMLMILLAQSCTIQHGFIRCSALNEPKSDPSFLTPAVGRECSPFSKLVCKAQERSFASMKKEEAALAKPQLLPRVCP